MKRGKIGASCTLPSANSLPALPLPLPSPSRSQQTHPLSPLALRFSTPQCASPPRPGRAQVFSAQFSLACKGAPLADAKLETKVAALLEIRRSVG
jgi:hypothetical protein